MVMRNIHILIVLIGFCPILLFGQETFNGKILSAADSAAVPSNIEVVGANGEVRKFQTDVNGIFSVKLPAGTYRFFSQGCGVQQLFYLGFAPFNQGPLWRSCGQQITS
jgi:hypothetical protein